MRTRALIHSGVTGRPGLGPVLSGSQGTHKTNVRRDRSSFCEQGLEAWRAPETHVPRGEAPSAQLEATYINVPSGRDSLLGCWARETQASQVSSEIMLSGG